MFFTERLTQSGTIDDTPLLKDQVFSTTGTKLLLQKNVEVFKIRKRYCKFRNFIEQKTITGTYCLIERNRKDIYIYIYIYIYSHFFHCRSFL